MNPSRLLLLVGLISAAIPVNGEEFAAEVYRGDDITIHASISEQPGRIIHFGDVLPLVVDISYDADKISLDEPDNNFFDAAWPEYERPVLVDRKTIRSDERLQTVFYFQILDCPGEQWTCPGTREYLLPEFNLNYRRGDTTETLRFRPWPSILTVSSAIPLDEEDQLFRFQKYFPTNAYPNPLSGFDHKRAAFGYVGVGMVALLGGMLMWPFRFKKTSPFADKSQARWQELLQELEDDDAVDEKRYFDRLRRSFVWYCTDELDTDPFDWLGSADQESELQSLFIDLLHCPSGQGPELRTRFTDLLIHGAQ